MRLYSLIKVQAACKLINYKKENFLNKQVYIPLNPADSDERLCEGMAISSSEIVSSTMKRLGNLDPFLNGSDFSNLGVAMNSCHPPHTHTPRCFLTVQQMPVSSPCWNHGELDSRHGRKIGTSWNLRGGRS